MTKSLLLITLGLSLCITSLNAQTYTDSDNLLKSHGSFNNGKKQGFWQIKAKTRNLKGYHPDSIYEQGHYENNRKVGTWERFYPDGKTKSIINYDRGRTSGRYAVYFPNGNLEETGNVTGRKLQDTLIQFYPSGCPRKLVVFRPQEPSIYIYYENDCLPDSNLAGSIRQAPYTTTPPGGWGCTFGTEKYRDTSANSTNINSHLPPFKSNEFWNDFYKSRGYDVVNQKRIDSLFSTGNKPELEIRPAGFAPDSTEIIPHLTSDGFHMVYNANKDIHQDGEFKNKRLWNGKLYLYDEDGLLEAIARYKNGKFVKYVPIE